MKNTTTKSRVFQCILIAPPANETSGSLLRPINIWYCLKNIKGLYLKYLAVRRVYQLFRYAKELTVSELAIISGVNPWIAAIIVFLRKLCRRYTIVDIHGFGFYEATILGYANILHRLLILASELLAYKYATHLIAASQWLAEKLKKCMCLRRIYILDNSTTPLFEYIVSELKAWDLQKLYRFIDLNIDSRRLAKHMFLAPLPRVFESNVLAHDFLLKLANEYFKDVLIIITGQGYEPEKTLNKVIYTGQLSYPKYVALLLVSDAVLLPFPKNAICGGVRNKILEPGFCGKPLLSTSTGMLFIPAIPMEHYIPLDSGSSYLMDENKWIYVAARLAHLVHLRYTFKSFKSNFLKIFLQIVEDKFQ